MTAIQVTATASGAGATNGILLRVVVLRNCAASQTGATGTQSAAAAHEVTITTTQTGSVTYGAAVNGASGAFSAVTGTTFIDNVQDVTNNACYGSMTGGTTGTPGGVTIGAVNSFPGGAAVMEVLNLTGQHIVVDDSGPVAVDSLAAGTVTTALFSPPAGCLLVAMVAANGLTGDVVNMTVSDSSSLSWTAAAQAHASSNLYAGVWYAFGPALGTPYAIGNTATAASSATAVISVGTSTTAGDAVIVGASTSNTDTVTGVTDTQGNVYSNAASTTNGYNAAFWVALNTVKLTSGSDSITVTYSAADTGAKNVAAMGCTGIAAANAVDVSPAGTTNAGSTTPLIASGALFSPVEVVFAWETNANGGGAISWGGTPETTIAGFHTGTSQYSSMAAWQTASNATANYSGTITSAKWGVILISLATVQVEHQFMSVPAYIFPPNAQITELIDAAPTTAIMVINVDNGPGASTEANFATMIAEVQAAGILAVGYVYTSYAARSTTAVEADIAAWNSLYGLTSILFDEVEATTANVTYYTTLVTYVYTATPGSTAILNPGVIPAQTYASTPIGDIIFVCEDTQANFAADAAAAPSWLFNYPSSRFGVTVNGCTSESSMVTDINLSRTAFNAKYVYVTDDPLYGTLPTYFTPEVEYLAGSGGGGGGGGGSIGTVDIVNTWTAVNSHNYNIAIGIFGAIQPNTTSMGIPVSNTAGNWLACVVSWRQDANTPGVIAYPTSLNVSDDAHNFWVPASASPPGTGGVIRTIVWVAPAARAANWVFVSSTGFQNAFCCVVLEIANVACPWYAFTAQTYTAGNQVSSITETFTPPAGVLSVGTVAYDNRALTTTITDTGWVEVGSAATSGEGGVGGVGDLELVVYAVEVTGGSLTLSGSSSGNMDWAVTMVSIHGLDDAIAMPYSQPIPNWPVLVTEMSLGTVLNSNPTFSAGTSPWAVTNGTLAASTAFTYGASAGSAMLTPNGSSASAYISSELESTTPFSTYEAQSWVYSPTGYSQVAVNIDWFNSSMSYLSSQFGTENVIPPGGWTEITVTGQAISGAAYGRVTVVENGTPPSSAVLYTGYASLNIPGSYQGTEPALLQWIDMSSRNLTVEDMSITRGIQYEQQSLEAGNASFALDNFDGALNFQNVFSPYYPQGGDTDIPVRIRAVWPQSITPYYSLYLGYTDQLEDKWSASWRSYVLVTASDLWSRLTAQMVTATTEEVLADSPFAYWQLGDAAGSVAAANISPGAAGPLTLISSKNGTTGITQAFGSTNISLTGDPGPPGGTGWSVSGYTNTNGSKGYSLGYFPSQPSSLPSLTAGITIEFWVELDVATAGITYNGSIAAGIGPLGRTWELSVEGAAGSNPGYINFTVWNFITGASTATNILATDQWNSTMFVSIGLTTSTWSVNVTPSTSQFLGTPVTGSATFSYLYVGLVFNGLNTTYGGLSGDGFNGELYGIAFYPQLLGIARSAAHYLIPLYALPQGAENDVNRSARVTGYGGFVPPLAMRGVDIDISDEVASEDYTPSDGVTAVTDTSGQVTSFYLTNMAQTTSAGMFVDGPGALVYRRREEWYGRTIGSWTFGEYAWNVLNETPVFSQTYVPWESVNNAVVTWNASTGLQRPFAQAVSWVPDGVTAAPGIVYGQSAYGATYTSVYPGAPGIPVAAGQSYTFITSWYSPQGYESADGVIATIQYLNNAATLLGSFSGNRFLVAGDIVYVIASGQAPAGSTQANLLVQATGTPPDTITFYNGSALFYVSPGNVPYEYEWEPAEVPYLPSLNLSVDRAQLFNFAYITQSGDQVEVSSLSGNQLVFQDSSGVIVQEGNAASIALRGQVPFTATSYLYNTIANGTGYYVNIPSIEDYGYWIVNTLGTPDLRGNQVEITPSGTPQAWLAALGAEVGDTATLNRRSPGAPVISVLQYISHLQHTINFKQAEWSVTYQLSGNPVAEVLFCDDPVHGVLTGENLIGW